ncbi:MAG TPA: hypothetical protein VNY36_03210 [Bacteroidia bacterium]|jgi:hypothetical protein|nr:hypothetical protein [Bacteroidia bacterium]
MSVTIYQLPTPWPATVGISPNFKAMVCGDDLSTISTEGYLNQVDLQSNPVSTTDILQILYNFNPQTQVGLYGSFSVSITDGIITLMPTSIPGEIILPVTTGDFANWANTSGALADSGYKPSNSSLSNVSMVDLTITPVSGDVVVFSDNMGSIKDSGISSSALVSLTSPPASIDYIAKFSSVTGNITSAPGATINAGDIQAGLSGTAGSFICYPPDANSGNFIINCPTNLGDYSIALELAPYGQVTNITIPDPANASAQILLGPGNAPFVNGNFPVAQGTAGIMIDSGISSSTIIVQNAQPKLYASQGPAVAQSVPSGVYTQLTLDTVTFDTASSFAANAYTVRVTGYYYVSYQIILQLMSGDTGIILTSAVYINGVASQFLANTGAVANADVTLVTSAANGVMFLTSGQILTLSTNQNSGANRIILSGGGPGNTFLTLSQLV